MSACADCKHIGDSKLSELGTVIDHYCQKDLSEIGLSGMCDEYELRERKDMEVRKSLVRLLLEKLKETQDHCPYCNMDDVHDDGCILIGMWSFD